MDDPKPRAKGGGVPGGVYDHGTQQEDGPETREALTPPHEGTADGEPAESESPTGPAFCGCTLEAGQEQDTRREVGRRRGEPEPRPKGTGSRRTA